MRADRLMRQPSADINPAVGTAYYVAPREPRVLFLGDHLGYADGIVHGGTTYFLQVLPALRAAGLDVAACFLRPPHPAARHLEASGIETRFVGASRINPFVIGPIAQMVQQGGYDVLHASGFKACLVARWLARRAGARAILHVHDMCLPPAHVRLLNRLASHGTEMGMCVSEATRHIAVQGYCIQPERVRIVYTGIDTDQFHDLAADSRLEVRRELGLSPQAPVLALVGRLYPVKGPIEMVRILHAITARLPECVLLLVGDGPERGSCEQLARSLGLVDRVRFLGTRADIPRILAATDVVVAPSRSEGLSRAAVEALLCGRPVVAYATGGLTEVVTDPVCGRLVPAGDIQAFADAVVAVLQVGGLSSPDAAADRVRIASERFAVKAHVRVLRECYIEACS